MSQPIVFFGSGPVAAKSLELLSKNFKIESVVTRPRPINHKGDVPVIAISEQLKLPFFTVSNKRELDELISRKPFKSKLGVLIDFGVIISQQAIDYFTFGIINSHFSLLPQWRGADPITFSIMSGQKETGVSLMLLVAAMDEGPLLATSRYTLPQDITNSQLTNDLIKISDELLKRSVPKYIDGRLKAFSQDETGVDVSYSRKLTKADGIIDWSKPAAVLEREVRAFEGWPKSRSIFGNLEVIVIKAHVGSNAEGYPGERLIIDKQPAVVCGKGALVLDMVRPVGKKDMAGEAFLAGYKAPFLGS